MNLKVWKVSIFKVIQGQNDVSVRGRRTFQCRLHDVLPIEIKHQNTLNFASSDRPVVACGSRGDNGGKSAVRSGRLCRFCRYVTALGSHWSLSCFYGRKAANNQGIFVRKSRDDGHPRGLVITCFIHVSDYYSGRTFGDLHLWNTVLAYRCVICHSFPCCGTGFCSCISRGGDFEFLRGTEGQDTVVMTERPVCCFMKANSLILVRCQGGLLSKIFPFFHLFTTCIVFFCFWSLHKLLTVLRRVVPQLICNPRGYGGWLIIDQSPPVIVTGWGNVNLTLKFDYIWFSLVSWIKLRFGENLHVRVFTCTLSHNWLARPVILKMNY